MKKNSLKYLAFLFPFVLLNTNVNTQSVHAEEYSFFDSDQYTFDGVVNSSLTFRTSYEDRHCVEKHIYLDNVTINGSDDTGAIRIINELSSAMIVYIHISGENTLISNYGSSPIVVESQLNGPVYLLFKPENEDSISKLTLSSNGYEVQTISYQTQYEGSIFTHEAYLFNSYSENLERYNYNVPSETLNENNPQVTYEILSHSSHSDYELMEPTVYTDCYIRKEIITCENQNCGRNILKSLSGEGEHAWSKLSGQDEPVDCSSQTGVTYKCDRCGITEDRFEGGAHNLEFTEYVQEPTCVSRGIALYTCSICGETETIEVEPTQNGNHNWSEWNIIIEPSCAEGGLKNRYCLDCQQTESENILPDYSMHEWSEWNIFEEPSCTQAGKEERYCMLCQTREERETDTLAHEWDFVDENPIATCTSGGVLNYRCVNCGATKQEVGQPNVDAHDWGEFIEVEAPTCLDPGRFERTCSLCGEVETEYTDNLGHNFEPTTIGVPTCITPSETKLICTKCGEVSMDRESSFEYDENNHEGTIQLIIDEAATTTKTGRGHKVWSCCGYVVDQMVIIPELTNESSKDVISDVIGIDKTSDIPPSEKSQIEEAIELISGDTLLVIAEEVNQKFEEIANLEDVSEEVKEEYIQTIVAATEGAVIAGAKLDNVKEEVKEISRKLPSNFSINLGEKLANLYQNQFDYVLGNAVDPEKGVVWVAISKAQENIIGIDYTEGAYLYKNVGEFIDTSVEHITQAALLVRECSNEKVTAVVSQYIEKVSVKSFRSFNKEAADLEFADNAYQAILVQMQEVTIANLDKEYAELSKNVDGIALEDLKREYNSQISICNNADDFEILITEIMRQKYNSILNERLDNGVITLEEYNYQFVGESEEDFENFKGIYHNIFYSWALGQDADYYGYTNPYGITLQELTDATIKNTSLKSENSEHKIRTTNGEIGLIVAFSCVSFATIAAFICYSIFSKKREAVK